MSILGWFSLIYYYYYYYSRLCYCVFLPFLPPYLVINDWKQTLWITRSWVLTIFELLSWIQLNYIETVRSFRSCVLICQMDPHSTSSGAKGSALPRKSMGRVLPNGLRPLSVSSLSWGQRHYLWFSVNPGYYSLIFPSDFPPLWAQMMSSHTCPDECSTADRVGGEEPYREPGFLFPLFCLTLSSLQAFSFVSSILFLRSSLVLRPAWDLTSHRALCLPPCTLLVFSAFSA